MTLGSGSRADSAGGGRRSLAERLKMTHIFSAWFVTLFWRQCAGRAVQTDIHDTLIVSRARRCLNRLKQDRVTTS